MLRICVPLIVVLATAPASAQDDSTSISVTETLLGERHGFNQDRRPDNDDYWDLKNRLNLSVTQGPVTGAVRVDTITYSGAPDDTYDSDYRFERASLRVDGDLASVTAGDFYVLFGRGIALSLRKIDELGVDTALRGARLDLHLPGRWETTLVAGTTNIVNVDDVNRRPVPDPEDRIVGGRAETLIADRVAVGFHAVAMSPIQTRLAGEADRIGSAGVDLGVPEIPGGFSLHLEGDLQWRRIGGVDPGEGDQEHRPSAVYADISWAQGPLTLTLEVKNYHDFQPLEGSRDPFVGLPYTYTQPPTAERVDQQVPDNRNVYGGRLRADLRIPGTEHAVFANYAHSRTRTLDIDSEGYDLEDEGAYQHGYGGAEVRFNGGLTVAQLAGGFRLEQEVLPDAAPSAPLTLFCFARACGDVAEDLRRMWHVDLDFTTSIAGPHGLHLSWAHQSWSQKIGGGDRDRLEYHRGTAILEYDYAALFAAAFGFEYDTEVDLDGVRQLFQFGDARYNVSQNLTLHAVVGTQRGGLKCVNGVCRTFPPFAGAKAEIIIRY